MVRLMQDCLCMRAVSLRFLHCWCMDGAFRSASPKSFVTSPPPLPVDSMEKYTCRCVMTCWRGERWADPSALFFATVTQDPQFLGKPSRARCHDASLYLFDLTKACSFDSLKSTASPPLAISQLSRHGGRRWRRRICLPRRRGLGRLPGEPVQTPVGDGGPPAEQRRR